MIGIKITQEIKDKNQQPFIQKAALDSIIRRGQHPNKFHVTENIVGGYQNRTDLHLTDGWKEVVNPTYDAANQKLGGLIEDGDTFTYEVIDLTPEEIADLLEANDEETARQIVDGYREDGVKLIEKTRTKMWRRVVLYPNGNNGLTKQQVGKMDRWLSDVYKSLLIGSFRQARNDINNMITDRGASGNQTLLEAAGMLDTAEWLQAKIQDYFTNNYDL